jgi:outer membrane protein OmpA-like peptidoglycan-associated protein
MGMLLFFGCATTPEEMGATEFNKRGFAYAEQGQYEQAISDFSKALEINSTNTETYYNRGVAYYKQGQNDKAISDFNKALEIDSGYDKASYMRRLISVEDQQEMAISDLNERIDKLKKENQRIRNEAEKNMRMMRDQNMLLNQQLDNLRQENQKTRAENKVLDEITTHLQLKHKTLLSKWYAFGKTVLVLLPDPDGHVGEIQIRNKHGSRIINQAGYAVSVSSGNAPQPPVIMPEEEVKQIFADALDAVPLPSTRFILYFVWESTELKPNSRATIKEIIDEIRKRASTEISVSGHTDRAGSNEFNIALSRKRAEYVRDLLIAEGIAPEAISVASHGEGNPIIKTPDNVREPRNRRVEVIIR